MEDNTIDNPLEARKSLVRLEEYISSLENIIIRLRRENSELEFRILEIELEKKIPKFIEIAQ